MQSFGVPPRAQYRFGRSDVQHVHEYFLGAVHVEYVADGHFRNRCAGYPGP